MRESYTCVCKSLQSFCFASDYLTKCSTINTPFLVKHWNQNFDSVVIKKKYIFGLINKKLVVAAVQSHGSMCFQGLKVILT